jgi:hypothetical protein
MEEALSATAPTDASTIARSAIEVSHHGSDRAGSSLVAEPGHGDGKVKR